MGPCKKPGHTCLSNGTNPPDTGTLNRQRSHAPSWAIVLHSVSTEINFVLAGVSSWLHNPGSKLDAYLKAAAGGLPAKVQAALLKIQPGPRHVLALRGYLKGKGAIETNWAWTAAESTAFKATPEYKEATQAIANAKTTFASLYPGYTLSTASLIRSLEKQISLWNGNKSVLEAGRRLHSQCAAELSRPEYSETPDPSAIARFTKFLKTHDVSPKPKVATPGLSGHGQLHAVDFIINQGSKTIASADSASIKKDWDDAGWTDKLQIAINKTSPRFDGPLPDPYEPWHYVYL